MLQVLSEELNRPRVDIHWEIYQSSKDKLNEQIPAILSTLITLLDTLLAAPSSNTQLSTGAPSQNTPLSASSNQKTALCSNILQCLSHLLSWVSLTEILTPGLLNTVFLCAKQGVVQQGGVGVQQGVGVQGEVGAHAMSCINEIVRRNMVPAQVEEFVLQLFQQTLLLLTSVTQGDIDTIDTG